MTTQEKILVLLEKMNNKLEKIVSTLNKTIKEKEVKQDKKEVL